MGKSWHWELPDGCKYISKILNLRLKLLGNQPGTIRVYGVGAKVKINLHNY